MANWREIAQVNSDGALPYNIQGSATALSGLLPVAQGGTGVDLSSSNGLIYKAVGGDTLSVKDFPDTPAAQGHVLMVDSEGALQWEDFTNFNFAELMDNNYVTNGQASVQFGNLSVSGDLSINGGIISWASEDVTTTASMVKLNADETNAVTSGEYGFKVNAGDGATNDPQLYWDAATSEWKVQNDASTTGEKVAVCHEVSTDPGVSLGNIGDLAVNEQTGKLFVKTPL